MNNRLSSSRYVHTRRAGGFTLVEALVAITLLLAVILFVAKIFSSASDVTGAGQASADANQEIAALERQVRSDFNSLSRDGFMVIECTAVRNDVNDPSSLNPDLWLNPDLAFDAFIRSDRIVFFKTGLSGLQVFANVNNTGDNRKPQSTESRVYYGHGFQIGDPDGDPTTFDDVDPNFVYLPPWFRGTVDYTTGSFDLIQPGARLWTLARQNVLLADDGGSQFVFGANQGMSAATIWDNAIRNSRVDAAASQLNDIQQTVYWDGATPRTWDEQIVAMRSAVYYPRAERTAATSSRVDHAVTTSTIGSAVSDFTIDWTYADGTGLVPDGNNPPFYQGVRVATAGDQPWFGLSDEVLVANSASYARRGVWNLEEEALWGGFIDSDGPVEPIEFEFFDNSQSPKVFRYAVVFGYNQARPLNDDPNGIVGTWNTGPQGVAAYTPFPRSIRFTMRLHDVNTRLRGGRLVQFVVNIPDRTK